MPGRSLSRCDDVAALATPKVTKGTKVVSFVCIVFFVVAPQGHGRSAARAGGATPTLSQRVQSGGAAAPLVF